MDEELFVDRKTAHALALAANDDAIDEAVRAGILTPEEGMAQKFDDTGRIHALVEKAIENFLARFRVLH